MQNISGNVPAVPDSKKVLSNAEYRFLVVALKRFGVSSEESTHFFSRLSEKQAWDAVVEARRQNGDKGVEEWTQGFLEEIRQETREIEAKWRNQGMAQWLRDWFQSWRPRSRNSI